MRKGKPLLPDRVGNINYEKLLRKIRRIRITYGSFAKKAGISAADMYAIRVGSMMSAEGEMRACRFFQCDCSDIRDIELPKNNKVHYDPNMMLSEEDTMQYEPLLADEYRKA